MTVIPDTCETCGAPKSHETLGLLIHGCVYQCGAAVASDASGHVYPALICRKALGIIAGLRAENGRLRAENVRIGDRNVLMATELKAIADTAEEALGEWLPVVIDRLPFDDLVLARTILDLATEALAVTPAAEAAPAEPVRGQADLELASAVGARTSCSSE